jgi:DNA helicase-2/ATP-dependent DNA helicase PcrA
MQLNEEQTLAVEHPLDEPACLIAGAGSGKTRVLTERVRYLMDKRGVVPKRICAVTFTNKAAGELLTRLGLDTTDTSHLNPRVSTIHSLALGAIRKNPPAFSIEGEFTLKNKVSPLDDYDQSQMMKKIIERGKITDTNPYRVLENISFHRARGVGFMSDYTEEIAAEAEVMHGGYHAMGETELCLWKLYEEEKARNSVVDFDDMLHLTVRRFRRDAKWRESIQRMWDHVLMDEAQDTNPVQWEFVNSLLAPDNMNIYVVGDMSQSIYGFNGAVPQILKDFSENWRGVQPKLYRIARNHRSGQKIVDMANAIQNKMTRTIPLKMESWRGMNGEKGKIEVINGTFSRDIASEIAVEIFKDNEKFLRDAATVANGGTPRESQARPISYRENCILVRAAIQIRDIEAELVKRRIPYVVRGGRGLLQTEEVRDVLAYMRLATNHNDFMAFVRAAGVPRRGCGEVALEKIRAVANAKYEGDLIAAAESDTKNAKIASFGGIVRLISQFSADPVAMLERTLALTQYTTYLGDKYKRDKTKVKTKLENLDRFAQLVEGMVADTQMTAEDIIFQLTLDRPKDDDESGSVTISTIHSAKGLEWKRVYVANVVESSLPHKFSMGSEDEIEEERRLFYVACTRARDYLNLCVPGMFQQPDSPNVIMLKPSRFLAEISVN